MDTGSQEQGRIILPADVIEENFQSCITHKTTKLQVKKTFP